MTTDARSTVRWSASSSRSTPPRTRMPSGVCGALTAMAHCHAGRRQAPRAQRLGHRGGGAERRRGPRSGRRRGCSAGRPRRRAGRPSPPSRSPSALVMSSTPPPARTSSANRSCAAAARSTPAVWRRTSSALRFCTIETAASAASDPSSATWSGENGRGDSVGREQHPDELVLDDQRASRRSTPGPPRRLRCRWLRCAGTGGRWGSRRSSRACASRRPGRPGRRRATAAATGSRR